MRDLIDVKIGEEEVLIERIKELKKKIGKRMVLLAHQYQRKEIVYLADHRGDSFGLSKIASENKEADTIVFCGVRFMVESADVLSRDNQRVLHPDLKAGCPLADMGDRVSVENAWRTIVRVVGEKNIIPIVYINSDVELKAFCGRNGGSVCTSTNAPAVFKWALDSGKKVFFFPDEHLGINLTKKLGIPRSEVVVWKREEDDGGLTVDQIRSARFILWNGYCHVHTKFTASDIYKARQIYHTVKIVVHPECKEEVVDLSDACGSTSFIERYCREAPDGSIIGVGTEINLVMRLAIENPTKKIFPLTRSLCPNMYKIDLQDLCWTLENIDSDRTLVVVPEETKKDARVALQKMLELAPSKN